MRNACGLDGIATDTRLLVSARLFLLTLKPFIHERWVSMKWMDAPARLELLIKCVSTHFDERLNIHMMLIIQLGMLLAATLSISSIAAAQTERPPVNPGTPKPGPTPLPILPALPSIDDKTFYAETDVPHGRVEQVHYKDKAGNDKRMHVYLPPDYDSHTSAHYPVLYINHGGGEDDHHWSAGDRGCANNILDNLIAAGKAKPMILVMPNTGGIASAVPPEPDSTDACSQEFLECIIPYVDSHYRTKTNRENRALAGLSMGGFVVMNTGLAHLDTFSELYVYSSGYFPDKLETFEKNFKSVLTDPKTNEVLLRVPLYMAEGETDIALYNGQATMSIFNKYGIRNFWVLSTGGHQWENWRRYLYQTAHIMFPGDTP